MIKTLKNAMLSLAVLLACSGAVFADGNAFTPLNFDDVSYPGTSKTVASTTTSPVVNASAQSSSAAELTGNTKMQSAILQLDNAQVEVRNELLNYKAKYSDVDAQYKLIKTERSALYKQVRATEKRIKQIDKAKEKIRKNMM